MTNSANMHNYTNTQFIGENVRYAYIELCKFV